ncbi:MAG TPA: hypothetical protein VIT91_06695 [Chthoniobacterales bacterium]
MNRVRPPTEMPSLLVISVPATLDIAESLLNIPPPSRDAIS